MTKRVMMNMRFEIVLLLVLFGYQPKFYSSSSPEQPGVNISCILPLCLDCWVHGLLGGGASCGRRRDGGGGRRPARSR